MLILRVSKEKLDKMLLRFAICVLWSEMAPDSGAAGFR